MQNAAISAKVGQEAKTLMFSQPDSVQEAIELYGEEAVLSGLLYEHRRQCQVVVRKSIEGSLDNAAAQKLADDFKMGTLPSVAKDPTKVLATKSLEELQALYAAAIAEMQKREAPPQALGGPTEA